jgi:hypothetical protein
MCDLLAFEKVILHSLEGCDTGSEGFLLSRHQDFYFVNLGSHSRSQGAGDSGAGRNCFRVFGGAAMPCIASMGAESDVIFDTVVRSEIRVSVGHDRCNIIDRRRDCWEAGGNLKTWKFRGQ